MLTALIIAALFAALYSGKKAGALLKGISGTTYNVTPLKRFASGAGTDQWFTLFRGPTELLTFRQWGSNAAYRLVQSYKVSAAELASIAQDLGLTVLPTNAQNTQLQGIADTNYRVDLMGAAPNGWMVVNIYKSPFGASDKLLTFWQSATNASTRKLIATDRQADDPAFQKALIDFKVSK